jgi:hypothetical protein
MNFYICYKGVHWVQILRWRILIDRVPRYINQKVLKNELLPRYFGPTADLSSHKYNFKFNDAMDNNAKVRRHSTELPTFSLPNRGIIYAVSKYLFL